MKKRKMLLKYRELLIEEAKLSIKIKKVQYKSDLLNLWRELAIAKSIEFEGLKEIAEKDRKRRNFKPREPTHI